MSHFSSFDNGSFDNRPNNSYVNAALPENFNFSDVVSPVLSRSQRNRRQSLSSYNTFQNADNESLSQLQNQPPVSLPRWREANHPVSPVSPVSQVSRVSQNQNPFNANVSMNSNYSLSRPPYRYPSNNLSNTYSLFPRALEFQQPQQPQEYPEAKEAREAQEPEEDQEPHYNFQRHPNLSSASYVSGRNASANPPNRSVPSVYRSPRSPLPSYHSFRQQSNSLSRNPPYYPGLSMFEEPQAQPSIHQSNSSLSTRSYVPRQPFQGHEYPPHDFNFIQNENEEAPYFLPRAPESNGPELNAHAPRLLLPLFVSQEIKNDFAEFERMTESQYLDQIKPQLVRDSLFTNHNNHFGRNGREMMPQASNRSSLPPLPLMSSLLSSNNNQN